MLRGSLSDIVVEDVRLITSFADFMKEQGIFLKSKRQYGLIVKEVLGVKLLYYSFCTRNSAFSKSNSNF